MVSEQVKRTLNQFTKEELIDGIIKSNYGNKNEILAVIDACYSVKLSKVEQAVKASKKEAK